MIVAALLLATSVNAAANCSLTVTASNDGPMCPAGGDTSVHLFYTANEPNVTPAWSSPTPGNLWTSGEESPNPPRPDQYAVQVRDSNGCTATALTTVMPKNVPAPVMNKSAHTICGGIATVTVGNASEYSNYAWSVNPYGRPATIVSGQGTPTVDVSIDPIDVNQAVVDVVLSATHTATGCPILTSATFLIETPVTAQISTAEAACPHAEMYASTPDEGPDGHYAWTVTHATVLFDSEHGWIRYTPNGDGDVTLAVNVFRTDSNCAASDAVTVPVSGPRAMLSGRISACAGDGAVSIPVALQGTPPFTIVWSDGVTQSGIDATTASRTVAAEEHTYTITSVSDAHCTGAANGEARIELMPAPEITKQPASMTIMPGTAVTLTASAVNDVTRFDWYEGTAGDRTHLVAAGPSGSYTTPPLNRSTSYWVEALNGCAGAQSSTAYITVGGRRRSTGH